MFDWPLHIHTSPIKILLKILGGSPLAVAVSVCGEVLTGVAGKVAIQAPDGLAMAVAILPFQLAFMVTSTFGVVVPHTRTGLSRWMIILLWNILLTVKALALRVSFTTGGRAEVSVTTGCGMAYSFLLQLVIAKKIAGKK
jgi:hypothetical protein